MSSCKDDAIYYGGAANEPALLALSMLVLGPTMLATSIVGVFEPALFFLECLAPFTMLVTILVIILPQCHSFGTVGVSPCSKAIWCREGCHNPSLYASS